jgi:hypothetical protein
VWDGHYTTAEGVDSCGPGTFLNTTNVVDVTITPTQVGSVTKTRVPRGECDLCPAGKYKAGDGDDRSLCLPCPYHSTNEAGHTPLVVGNSTKDRTSCECYRPDGGGAFDQLYFNVTTGKCLAVPLGFVSPSTHDNGLSRRTRFPQCEGRGGGGEGGGRGGKGKSPRLANSPFTQCEEGYWCSSGVRTECAPGRYGGLRRETNSSCSGPCDPGYYCTSASPYKRQNPCGGAHLFCPANSSTPTRVADGYYTNEDAREEARSSQLICPPGFWCKGGERFKCRKGHFGASEGNTDEACDGKCRPGHFCLEGSISSTQNQCGGSHVYCPEGSFEVTPVSDSYYTVAGQIDLYLRDKKDVLNKTMSAQKVCPPGWWCSSGIAYQCPEGTWSNNYGMRGPGDCGQCEEGYFCPSYPLTSSTDPMRHECGRVDLYCPQGSHRPTNVTVGHYTHGGDRRNTTRVGQFECEEGHYCRGGVKRICPAGKFGAERGMTGEECGGTCPAAHMCPEGTVVPIPCGEGEYSAAGAWMCNSCGKDSQAEGDDGSQRCRDSRKCCFY